MGIALAANAFTLFLFYEALTLVTYPLVTHHGTAEARRSGRIYLALVNVDPNRPARLLAEIAGAEADTATGRILTGPEMDTRNTFDAPHTLEPTAFEGSRDGDTLVFELPPKSVAVVALGE